jgi:hypothetical protein
LFLLLFLQFQFQELLKQPLLCFTLVSLHSLWWIGIEYVRRWASGNRLLIIAWLGQELLLLHLA